MIQRFDIITARFNPKRLDTLRESARPYIGIERQWMAAWKVDEEDGGPYVGQWAFTLEGEPRLPIGWVPEEDLEEVPSQ